MAILGRKNSSDESAALATADSGIDSDEFLSEGDPSYESSARGGSRNGILIALTFIVLIAAGVGAWAKGYIPGMGRGKPPAPVQTAAVSQADLQNKALKTPEVIEDAAPAGDGVTTSPEAQGIVVNPTPENSSLNPPAESPGRVSVPAGETVTAADIARAKAQPSLANPANPAEAVATVPTNMPASPPAMSAKETRAAAAAARAAQKSQSDALAQAEREANLERARVAQQQAQPAGAVPVAAPALGAGRKAAVRHRAGTRLNDLPYDDPRAPWNKGDRDDR